VRRSPTCRGIGDLGTATNGSNPVDRKGRTHDQRVIGKCRSRRANTAVLDIFGDEELAGAFKRTFPGP
jgi:hypothetical protein